MKQLLGVVATGLLCLGAWAEGILDDKAFLERYTFIRGKGLVKPVQVAPQRRVETWGEVIDKTKVCISQSEDIVAFADLETIDRFFRYYFEGNEVVIKFEDEDTLAYDCHTMTLGPATMRVAEQADFPEELLGDRGRVDLYTFKVGDAEHALAHAGTRRIHTLAMFTWKPGCLLTLTSHVSDPYVRYWRPQILSVESGGRVFLLIPNFQGGTSSDYHAEYLKVFDLTEGRLDEIASTLVFESWGLGEQRYLRSEILVDQAGGTIAVNKDIRSGYLGGPFTRRHEQEVIDLRRKPMEMEPPKPVTREEYQRLLEEGDLLRP